MSVKNPSKSTLSNSVPWIEKYRPKSLDEISHHRDIINMLKNCLQKNDMPHLLFHGPPGTGKTSSAIAICRELYGAELFPSRVFELNASDDRGINAVRQKIKYYARLAAGAKTLEDGRKTPAFKIIILDEADSMTREAQDALRVIIEENSHVTRFIFICNYHNQIIEPIKSRCAIFHFQPLSHDSMISKLQEISKREEVKCSSGVIEMIISISKGDMRKAIMTLQNLKYIQDVRVHLKGSSKLEKKDVMDISGYMDPEICGKILKRCLTHDLNSVIELAQMIINESYPIDIFIVQMNEICMESKDLTDLQKAQIIIHGAEVQKRIIECADEELQLKSYLGQIYSVTH